MKGNPDDSLVRGNPEDRADASSFDVRESIGRTASGSSRTTSSEGPPPRAAGVPDAPRAAESAASSGRYAILGETGRGGMGIVYRARHENLAREVAIKTLKPSRAEDPAARAAFLAEARIAAGLEHPNIVPVHDLASTPDGGLAISMKLVGGISWLELLHPTTEQARERARAFTLERHLEILLAAGNAVAYAHSRGIIHRDLKPSNVMVGRFGEVYVMDWGMAWRFDGGGDGGVSAPGIGPASAPPARACGTPGYMAPEQVQAGGGNLGPWTDVYLLGAILYEVLTGRPPHDGRTLKDVLRAAHESAPPPFPKGIPAELQEICRTAMARRIRDRHPGVEAFQDAVRDHLRHRESHALARDADERLAALEPEVPRSRRGERSRPEVDYAGFAEAVAGYRQALKLWSGNAAAARGLSLARFRYARAAHEAGDHALALAQLDGLEEPGSEQLRAEVESAAALRRRTERAARRLRAGLAIAAVVIFLGLATGIVLVNAERRRADRNAEAAAASAGAATESAERAEASAALARENERKAVLAAERMEVATRERLAAIEAREAEARRAAEAAAALALKTDEAQKLEARTQVSEDRARAIEAESRAETERARAAAERQSEAVLAAELAADAERLKRLENAAEVMVRSGAIPAAEADAWLTDAEGLLDRFPAHVVRLVESSLAGAGTEERRRALRPLADLASEYARVRDLLAAASGDAARAELRERAARLEKDLVPLVKHAAEAAGREGGDAELARRRDEIAGLAAGISRFADPEAGAMQRIRRRRAEAPVRPAAAAASPPPAAPRSDPWPAAIRAVSGSPKYRGVALRRDDDLLPLGPDPRSGLHEFLHLPSHDGPVPARAEDGTLAAGEGCGAILVLLPGGRSWMGSQSASAGQKNFVPGAPADEAPVHAVDLAPFLIAKHELTQAQWRKLAGTDPSRHGPSANFARKQHTLRHPVESVSHDESRRVLEAAGLLLPTEAQWEYAARAGSAAARWCDEGGGPDLAAAANLGDRQFRRYFKDREAESWDDGWMMHAAAGSFAPNAFGLHDVLGNVSEWCADAPAGYDRRPAPGTGERSAAGPGSAEARVHRGGSFESLAPAARSGARASAPPDTRSPAIGVRPSRRLDR